MPHYNAILDNAIGHKPQVSSTCSEMGAMVNNNAVITRSFRKRLPIFILYMCDGQ